MAYLITLAALYLLLVLTASFFQGKLIYYPTRELEADPLDVGLDFESVWLKTQDHIKIHGWFIPRKGAKDVVLFCHGNGGNISHRVEVIKIYHDLGFNVFIFDYRGYGKSEGKPTEKGTYLDAEAVYSYVINDRGFAPANVILLGRSLGGAVASYLAEKKAAKALVLESVFTSVKDMAKKMFPILPVRIMHLYGYSSIDRMGAIKCPTLIIHSPEDEIVPFDHAKRLFERANEPKTFLEIKGSHNDGFAISETLYKNGISGFFSRLVEAKER